jgi:hypothetical protein
MIEGVKVLLLAAIFGVLLWMASHPTRSVGRFVPLPDNDYTDLLFDSTTGKTCIVYPKANFPDVPNCASLK